MPDVLACGLSHFVTSHAYTAQVFCRTSAGHTVSNIAVSADGQHFACSSGRRVHLVDVLAHDVEGSR